MKNGIIGILLEDRKAIDLKVTNSFPMVALQPKASLVVQDKETIDISGFQHLSIPSDLSIHLTRRDKGSERPEYVFFDAPKLQSLLEMELPSPQRLFTFVGAPVHLNPQLQGVWQQAAILSPLTDADYDASRTRAFIDFFVHQDPKVDVLVNQNFATQGMRLAYDRTGCIFGPYAFDGLQRNPRVTSPWLFSIRYGYAEMPVGQDCYVYIPYEIRKRGNSG